ncbi:uncharacterized protein LOC127261652 [Andrographis paniculata]|uniref:uncharacterized protein LOC127261652 n=1 Tax=Andrographis paniculata TaxID=175694 RepID=UPI0021E7477A|nr:uncharacterized protein LOC127261652 [Andrographis paniculata]
MYCVWSSSCRVMAPQWRRCSSHGVLHQCKRKLSFAPSTVFSFSSSTSNDDISASSKQPQVGYDPSEELFGLADDLHPRNVSSSLSKPRSWFGPNGQYIRELPCPSCRGRGYTPCADCGIERSRPDCSQCNGKGIVTCNRCHGECVIWEESIDEQPWENARSISPLKVKEDDEVDKLDIKLKARRKAKNAHQSSDPQVNLKISRSLKSLNAKTGIFSKRMKIIHKDPILHAQRVTAIKKAKGTAAARRHASEAMKRYFADPENRRKRSISMIGAKFHCRNCGQEGHRRNYCPKLMNKGVDRRTRCRVCGEKGHNRRTCPKSAPNDEKSITTRDRHRCKICHQSGHNRRTCPQVPEVKAAAAESETLAVSKRRYTCNICREKGHNTRTCPQRK